MTRTGKANRAATAVGARLATAATITGSADGMSVGRCTNGKHGLKTQD